MSIILSIYSQHAFKEYLLPAIDNADFELVLPKELFELRDDVTLRMEIMDGSWRFQKMENIMLYYTAMKAIYGEENLKDGDVFTVNLGIDEQISIIVKETDKSFTVYEKFRLDCSNELTIGKAGDNTFSFDFLGLISNHHGRIFRQNDQFIIEDLSTNGIFVNSKRVGGARQLRFGDNIDIFGLRFVFLTQFIAVNTLADHLSVKREKLVLYEGIKSADDRREKERDKYPDATVLFHRAPRNIPKIETDMIEIEAPPAAKELNVQSALLTIGPSLTMALPMLGGVLLSAYSSRMSGGGSGLFMYTGLVTAVGSAVLGSTWSIVNMKQSKKKNREEELKRFQSYSEYLIRCTNEIKDKYENNGKALQELYPDAQTCCSYNEHNARLWSRNYRHEDFLSWRLGIGDIPFQVRIEVPKTRFSVNSDSLSEKPALIKESYKILHNVPICIDLRNNNLVGLIGGDKKRGCYQVMWNLVTQIAANNCYTDIKMAFIYDDENEGEEWEFAKWLPHVWSEDKKTRYVAGNKSDASEVFYEITKVLRMRQEEKSSYSNKKEVYKPYYILFLEKPELLEGELIAKYLFDTENNCGVSTFLMAQRYEELPNTCEFIVENTNYYQGMYYVTDGQEDRVSIQFDAISAIQVERFARSLSRIEVSEIEVGGEIPNVLTFFDMYGVQKPQQLEVLERWKKNRTYDSIKALVGQKAGGADCYLDVHEKYHGPHGLVAGTTGSGKSETLQTYMLSLAINYSPDDVGFFVIDYKGGGMANLFEGLPHMIGQISNLSGNQVRRAMVSIKSENKRRQRVFNEHGVNNINLYTRLYKNKEAAEPIPHMFIIIDEFAELKREEPDFMRELISVAQVGRSLGVHLILATQKPSGTVDDNIWSNSKFRLCLRVQDRQDSTDMLHRPEAAYITQAGRCYLQVGNDELFELFQSAWSGAAYDDSVGTVATDIAKMLSRSGKASLVGSFAKMKQKEQAKVKWVNLLVAMLQQAAKEAGTSLEEAYEDKILKYKVIDGFFKAAAKEGIEYPMSDYNLARAEDLFKLYRIVENENPACQGDQLAEALIAYSGKKGLKLPEIKEKTQLDAVVEYLAELAKKNGYNHNLKLWLPVLPKELYLNTLPEYVKTSFAKGQWRKTEKGFSLKTVIGMYDDPVNQAQGEVYMDLAEDGNHAIIGTITSGKSTFLMTYIYSLVNHYSPEYVNLYILDFSSKMLGAFNGLAHVGGVMFENDLEKVSKFFTMMEGMIKERKKLFQGGSYSQYVRANPGTIPAVIILIDNMSSFRAKTNNAYDDFLMELLKEGISYGIYVVATAAGFGMNEIPSRMGDNFRTVVCLEMNDKYAYTEVLRTMHLEVLPEVNVKGRGLIKMGDRILEFQTALCIEAEDDFKRGEEIQKVCDSLNNAYQGKAARTIPEIPKKPNWTDFCQLEEVVNMAREGEYLPIGYNRKNAFAYGIDLRKTYCYLISGKARTGKTNTLRLFTLAASLMGGKITVIDFTEDLRKVAEKAGAGFINTPMQMHDFFENMITDFKARNFKKREYSAKGLSNEEIFEQMQEFEKQFIIIGDLTQFVDKVHHPGPGIGTMAPFLSNILDKGSMHNVFWFAGVNQDEAARVAGLDVYTFFVKDKCGMHLGGNVAAQRLLPFDHIPFMEQSKSMKPGTALLTLDEEKPVTAVVLPMYRME